MAGRIQEVRVAAWFAKSRDLSYEDVRQGLGDLTKDPRTLVFQRQLVLGPAPEFCVLGATGLEMPKRFATVASKRTCVWPGDTKR